MSSVLATVRTMVGLAASEDDDSRFLLPSAVHDELAVRRLRREIEEARQEIRDAQANYAAAVDALGVTREPFDRALADHGGVEPALARARTAREADGQARREALEHGGTVDPLLGEAAESALKEVREARRAAVAAKDVLPVLEQRVRDADSAVQSARGAVGQAVAQVMVATLALRVHDSHAAAARLSECYLSLASLSETFLRGRDLGVPTGSVPMELVPLPPEFQFTSKDLEPGTTRWCEFATRLREDPGAEF